MSAESTGGETHVWDRNTESDSKVVGHWGWVGTNGFHDKEKNFVWGKKEMDISAVLKALLDWEIQVKGLNCHGFLKREKFFYKLYKFSCKFCHLLLLLLPRLFLRAATCPFARPRSSLLPSLSSSVVTSLLSRAGEQAVRGDVLEGRIRASEGLTAELLQRSAITCSWGSTGSCFPPVPPLSKSPGCWSSVLLEAGQEDVHVYCISRCRCELELPVPPFTRSYLRNVWKLNKGLTDNFADSCLCAWVQP